MEWTDADTKALRQMANDIVFDDIKIKQQIKKSLLNNRFIIHVLNNKELEEQGAEPEDYYGVNILPTYMVLPTQTNVQNYICFEVSYDEVNRYNSCIKELDIIFYILCEQKNLIDEETGIPRHDLLASLIQDWFNYTNDLGTKIHLISDVASVVDTNYACRTLTFRQTTDNNLVKSRNLPSGNRNIIANKGLVYPSEQT